MSNPIHADRRLADTGYEIDYMVVEVHSVPRIRVAAVACVGPYRRIADAFDHLSDIAEAAGLFGRKTTVIAVHYHDPGTPSNVQLHAAAALRIPFDAPIPRGTYEIWLPAGHYARVMHIGPYSTLGDAWDRLLNRELGHSRLVRARGVCYEIYCDEPGDAPDEEWRTALYVPVVRTRAPRYDSTPTTVQKRQTGDSRGQRCR